MQSIAQKLRIGSAHTLLSWVRRAQINTGQRGGVTTDQAAEMRRLRADVKELKRPILKSASVFFAAELNRRYA